MKKIMIIVVLGFFTFMATACQANTNNPSDESSDDKIIRVASHTSPMTDVIEVAAEVAKRDGWEIELIQVNDNVQYNELLNNQEVDANFAQHEPFMNNFNEERNGNLVVLQKIYDAKVGFYSREYNTIDEIPNGATVALPNDFSNLGRALAILDDQGLITLREGVGFDGTLDDIVENPKELEWLSVDLLNLPETYDESDVALVFSYPAHIAKLNLNPNDAMFLETNIDNRFSISLVAREDNMDSEKIQALIGAMTSPEVREFLENEHSDTLVPSF